MSDCVRPHRQQPTRLHPWDSPGKNTGVGISLPQILPSFLKEMCFIMCIPPKATTQTYRVDIAHISQNCQILSVSWILCSPLKETIFYTSKDKKIYILKGSKKQTQNLTYLDKRHSLIEIATMLSLCWLGAGLPGFNPLNLSNSPGNAYEAVFESSLI